MVIKLLGALDLFTGTAFLIQGVLLKWFDFQLFPWVFITILGLIILIKGLIFLLSADAVSFLDVASGSLIIISPSINLPLILFVIVAFFLIQKGIFSLIG